MKRAIASALFLSALSTAVFAPRDAEACGGCFVPEGPSTQVTAHRMAFALSSRRTILWDQIQYVGAPSEFGWVLPIRGKVDIGVSSELFFQRLETETQVQIIGPPTPQCPSRSRGAGESSDFSSSAPPSDNGGVNVWDQKVVGPYEATQLSATDGTALRNWLLDHKYTIPTSVDPIIDKYIAEGFGFLVIKLVPQADVSKMVPIRISYDGSNPTLPLRMIAAGTGAKVGLKLFVLGEGRWDTKNFPVAEIKTEELVWDYAAMGSNWNTLQLAKLAQDGGRTWLVESSDDVARGKIVDGLPSGTTTTDAGTVFATDTDQTELDRAFPGRATYVTTRMFAELPQSALGQDLELQASLAGKVPRVRTVTNTTNHPCPGSDSTGVFGCDVATPSSGSFAKGALGVGFVALALGLARRRRHAS